MDSPSQPVNGDMSDPLAELENFDALLDEIHAVEIETEAGRHLYQVQREIFLAREARLALRAAELADLMDALTSEP